MDLAYGADAIPATQALTVPAVVRLLRRRVWWILACAVLGAGAATAISLSFVPQFTAAGKITIVGESFAIPELQGALRNNSGSEPMLLLHTELQTLSSRQLLQRVAIEVHAAERPEFNPALRPPSLLNRLLASLPQHRPTGPAAVSAEATKDGVTAALARNLVVFNDNHSLVIDLSFTSSDPQFSANVINTLIKDYIAGQAEERRDANLGANAALVDRIDHLNTEIAGLDRQVDEIRERNQMVDVRTGSVGQQQLEDLATAATRATLERSQVEDTWQRATMLARTGRSDELAAVLSSETITKLREAESAASAALANLTARHGSAYPGVSDARASLDSTRRQLAFEVKRIIGALTSQLDGARGHESFALQQLAQARADAMKGASVQARIDDLKQQIVDRRSLAQKLLESTQLATNHPIEQQTPDVHILSLASAPTVASSPKPKLAGAFGLMAGGVVGCLLALSPLRAAEPVGGDTSKTDGLPMVGALPPRNRRRGSIMDRILIDPDGPEAEVLRSARLRIRLSSRSTMPRVIALVPVQDVETAWLVPAAFARLAALDGERVLLIEGNLQDPRLARSLAARPGELLGVLAGQVAWREALDRDPGSSLDMLVTQKASGGGYGLLSGTRFQNLLAEAQDDYTLIILSTPSLERSADALLLAHRADASLVIFSGSNGTNPKEHRLVKDLIRSSNGPVRALICT